jgi:hypothetical protein
VSVSYDARTKKRIKEALYDALYGQVNKEQFNTLVQIIRKNSIKCQNSQHCFKYKGILHSSDPKKLVPRPVNWLHTSFFNEMELYLDEKKTLERDEIPHVMGFVVQVLNSSDSFKDYFKLLPESLHPILIRIRDQCPCRNDYLDEKQIERIQAQNISAVNLLRRRVTINLLTAS